MGGLPYYIEVFPEIPHDAAYKKNLGLLIYEMISITIVLTVLIVKIAALTIHTNNKNSA